MKSEIRTVLYEQLEKDELATLKQLDRVDSTSADIIIRLQLTRPIVKEIYSQLRDDRKAQITITRVLGATRFKYAHRGHLLEVRCPKCRREPDTYIHMLECYALQALEATGAQSIDFLVDLAKKVKTSPPHLIFPILVEA